MQAVALHLTGHLEDFCITDSQHMQCVCVFVTAQSPLQLFTLLLEG